MREVAIIGVGMTPVTEHWSSGLRELAAESLHAALQDGAAGRPDALYVANAYGALSSSQAHLGALVADFSGLTGIEASTIESGDASGGAALRAGYLAVASGAADVVAVVGVEKSADAIGAAQTESRSVSLDADYEAIHGLTLTAQAALLMRRYMYEHGVEIGAFEGFSINAHANGKRNPRAMYRNAMRAGAFAKAPMVADPVNLFDSAPDADGAATVILAPLERALDMVARPIVIAGSAAATDTLALHDRPDPLFLSAVARSTQLALGQAQATPDDVRLFELHDAFTILTALSLEAAGFAERGKGWQWASDDIALNGRLPISTFGGLKSRGNPAGATGVYQAAEAVLQLRGEAGENQVSAATQGSQTALIQSVGGLGSSVFTHVLRGFESYQSGRR
ncbi:MAG: thiolase domain-containing protein [Anaerolineaceae bacterium]|nr:MAG: thiolase domain-containing protein [Anaerolineaceae bacterium]